DHRTQVATFGGDGMILTDFAGAYDDARGVAIQADGRIVAAGYVANGPASDEGINYDFALARYNPDRTLDDTFGGDGKVTTDFAGGTDVVNAVAVQRDGRIIAAGFTSAQTVDFALARYNKAGSAERADPPGQRDANHCVTASGADLNAMFGVPE